MLSGGERTGSAYSAAGGYRDHSPSATIFTVAGPTSCSVSSIFLLVMGTKQCRTDVEAHPRAPASLKGPWVPSADAASSFSEAALHILEGYKDALRRGILNSPLVCTMIYCCLFRQHPGHRTQNENISQDITYINMLLLDNGTYLRFVAFVYSLLAYLNRSP